MLFGCCGVYRFRFFRRFGAVSFTVYYLQWIVMDTLRLALNAMAGFTSPFCFGPVAKDSACDVTDGSSNFGVFLL